MIHVLGAGSIGTLFAHHLLNCGVPVTLLLHSQTKLHLLKSLGHRICVENAKDVTQLPRHSAVVAEVSHSDGPAISKLLVTTKANQAASAVRQLAPRLGPESVVVLLLNGVLGVYEELVQDVFPNRFTRPAILLGSTTHGVFTVSPFHVVHAGVGDAAFGLPLDDVSSVDSRSALAIEEVQQTLGSLTALQTRVSVAPRALQEALLTKLVVNCCLNPLTALVHCRNGGLLGTAAAVTAWPAIIKECKEALGDALVADEGTLSQCVHTVAEKTSLNYNSMLQDVVASTSTEIDYLNGYIVRKSKLQGRPTPWNSMLCTLIQTREQCPPKFFTAETLRQ